MANTEASRAAWRRWQSRWDPVYRKRRTDQHKARTHGITVAAMHELLSKPCGICGGPSAHIDHNHDTGEVRAALCGTCNHGIGSLKDSPNLLRAAIAYLEKHSSEVLL